MASPVYAYDTVHYSSVSQTMARDPPVAKGILVCREKL